MDLVDPKRPRKMRSALSRKAHIVAVRWPDNAFGSVLSHPGVRRNTDFKALPWSLVQAAYT